MNVSYTKNFQRQSAAVLVLLSSCIVTCHPQTNAQSSSTYSSLLNSKIHEKTISSQKWERAHKLYEQGNYAEALKAFSQIIKNSPKDSLAYEMFGNSLLKLKRYDDAAASINYALKLDPTNQTAKYSLQKLSSKAKSSVTANSSSSSYISSTSSNSNSKKQVQGIDAIDDEQDPIFQAAETYFFNKRHSEAIPLARKAAKAGNIAATSLLGELNFIGKGMPANPEKGFELFKSAANNGYPLAILNLSMCYHYGYGATKDEAQYTKLLKEAKILSKKKLRKYPKNLNLLYTLATCYDLEKRDRSALTTSKKYLKLLSKSDRSSRRITMVSLAASSAFNLKRYREAAKYASEWKTLEPVFSAFYILGYSSSKQKLYGEAERAFLEGLKHKNDPRLYMSLAFLYTNRQLYNKAKVVLNEAKKSNTKDPQVLDGIKQLEPIISGSLRQ